MTRKERKAIERGQRKWERNAARKFKGLGKFLISSHPLAVGSDWTGKRASDFLSVCASRWARL
jgi:hypothetical protein